MKLIVRDERGRQNFIDFVKTVDLKKTFVAIFEPVKKKRSLGQNSLLHLWMQVLEGDTGTHHEVWKQYFKERFLSVYSDNCFGEEVKTVQGTHDLNTKEFTDFLDKIHQQAAEEGYYLPWPEDAGYDDMILKYGNKVR